MRAKATLLSQRNDWKTPKGFYQALDGEFGFDFDPCPPDPGFDGLSIDWGTINFCNPPYRDLAKWIQKGHEQWCKGKTVVFLIPARTDTKAWHRFILPDAHEIRFIKGRLYFDDGAGRATFPSVVVVFRAEEKTK
jgi:site-specific DNA-methyltransferase (adenine-specific)